MNILFTLMFPRVWHYTRINSQYMLSERNTKGGLYSLTSKLYRIVMGFNLYI